MTKIPYNYHDTTICLPTLHNGGWNGHKVYGCMYVLCTLITNLLSSVVVLTCCKIQPSHRIVVQEERCFFCSQCKVLFTSFIKHQKNQITNLKAIPEIIWETHGKMFSSINVLSERNSSCLTQRTSKTKFWDLNRSQTSDPQLAHHHNSSH